MTGHAREERDAVRGAADGQAVGGAAGVPRGAPRADGRGPRPRVTPGRRRPTAGLAARPRVALHARGGPAFQHDEVLPLTGAQISPMRRRGARGQPFGARWQGSPLAATRIEREAARARARGETASRSARRSPAARGGPPDRAGTGTPSRTRASRTRGTDRRRARARSARASRRWPRRRLPARVVAGRGARMLGRRAVRRPAARRAGSGPRSPAPRRSVPPGGEEAVERQGVAPGRGGSLGPRRLDPLVARREVAQTEQRLGQVQVGALERCRRDASRAACASGGSIRPGRGRPPGRAPRSRDHRVAELSAPRAAR